MSVDVGSAWLVAGGCRVPHCYVDDEVSDLCRSIAPHIEALQDVFAELRNSSFPQGNSTCFFYEGA